jgi:predicted oxidoreductase
MSGGESDTEAKLDQEIVRLSDLNMDRDREIERQIEECKRHKAESSQWSWLSTGGEPLDNQEQLKHGRKILEDIDEEAEDARKILYELLEVLRAECLEGIDTTTASPGKT